MKKLVLLTVFLPFIYTALCQYPVIHIERLSDQQGLHDNWLQCLLQDRKGFIWIGGENGLYRCDGYNIVYFKDPPGCTNCPHFYPVYDAVEDNQGMLWIISFQGITIYNPEKERSLVAYRIKNPNFSGSSFRYSLPLDLMKDSQGNIWATNKKGLIRFSYKENYNNKEIPFDKDAKSILNIDFIHLSQDTNSYQNLALKIYEDSEGNIWTGCFDGLYVMRKGDSSFYRLEKELLIKNPHLNAITDIMQQNKDTFWISFGRVDNIYLMTNVQKTLHESVPDGSLLRFTKFVMAKNQTIYTLYKNRNNHIFIGTNNDVFMFKGINEKRSLNFESLYKKTTDTNNYLNNIYYSNIIEDRSGMLWRGHQTIGIMKFNPDRPKFISNNNLASNNLNLINLSIDDIHIDIKGNIWLGVWGSGLYRIHKESNQINRYDLGKRGNEIVCFEEIYPGIFWVGLGNTGVLEFNALTGKFRDPLPEGSIANDLREKQVNDILKDENQLYIVTSFGLNVYDLIKKRLVDFYYPYNYTSSNMMTNWMLSPIKLKNGDIITASAFHGILKINYNAEKNNLSVNCIVADSFLRNRNIYLTDIFRLYQDSQGSLWLVEKAGLHRINLEKGEIYDYKLFKNIEFPEAWSIIEDNRGNLWIGTHFGLCRFNIKTGQTKIFSKEDGVPISLHQYNSVCKDKDGRFYFGGVGGFYSFHPDSIKTSTYIPPVVITDFKLFNKTVSVDTAKKAILKKNISYTDKIELRHNQNDLSFEFAALDYNLPLRNQYAYKLEGYQKDWVETDADNRTAIYTNLDPGTYTFRVKGSNSEGLWNEEGSSLTIIIHKPWWTTAFAWCMYVLIFISSILGYIRWRLWKLRKEKLYLEKQVNERTQQIEEQKEELLQQKEELQSTLENLQKMQEQLIESEKMAALGGLVAGVAHEINTPVGIGVTAVSSLQEEIQKMAALYKKEAISRKDFKEFLESANEFTQLIQKNLERTASLVQSFKQVSADQASEQQRIFAFRDYLNDILSSLRPKFRDKKIDFKIECDDKLQLNSYPGVYAQIFTNLLLNSLQHGFPEKETCTIGIKAEMNKELLKIQYTDDGAGISKKDLPHIFEPFYTSDQHRGTGLGLNIVYNLIRQKLHGTITCESETGEGVLFKIEVPIK